ncbi:unnamed protein product [Adineta steineri]|uniref:Uncharacterized protein n=2 Tax=Adineta steineri TaxID=433720 RepID=A0A814C3E4_9BILA|nr:unnamed protein product [Adineta steineri]
MNTRLPCLIHLDISYEDLETVTENFTRDATRRSCAQLNRIQFYKSIIIAQSFPYLTDLSIHNHEQQEQHKRLNEADENNPQLSIIEFSHLNNLRLGSSHIDYAENFLDEMNTRLPCLIHLDISYENLEIVTENFTRDATRRSCAQLNRIQFHKSIVLSQNFYLYFSSLK